MHKRGLLDREKYSRKTNKKSSLKWDQERKSVQSFDKNWIKALYYFYYTKKKVSLQKTLKVSTLNKRFTLDRLLKNFLGRAVFPEMHHFITKLKLWRFFFAKM